MLRRALTDPLPSLPGRWAAAIVLATIALSFVLAWRTPPLGVVSDGRPVWECILSAPTRGGPLSFVEPLGIPGDDRLIGYQAGCTGSTMVLVPRARLEETLSFALAHLAYGGERVNPLAREAVARWSVDPIDARSERALIDRLVGVPAKARDRLDRQEIARLRALGVELLRRHPVAASLEAAIFGALAHLLVAPWRRGRSPLRLALHVALAPALFVLPVALGFHGDARSLHESRGPYAAVASLGIEVGLFESIEWPRAGETRQRLGLLRFKVRVLSGFDDPFGRPARPVAGRLLVFCTCVALLALATAISIRAGTRLARGPMSEPCALLLLVAPPSAACALLLTHPRLVTLLEGLVANYSARWLCASPHLLVWSSATGAAVLAALLVRARRPREEPVRTNDAPAATVRA